MNRRPNVALTDVARAAGVSKSTASRALRRESRVSEETIKLVHDTAAALGYVPDRRAAQLRSTEPTTVGLLLRGAERSFYGAIAAEMQSQADERGLDLLIVNGGDTHDSQMRAIENLLGHRVAGIIIASGRASMPAVEHAASFVPTVLVGVHSTSDTIDSVAIDPASEDLLAQRVLEAGHRTVAVTTTDAPESTVLHSRSALYESRLSRGGARTLRLPLTGSRPLAEKVRSVVEDGATAIMAGDDPTAVEILEILASWDAGSEERTSVTGFDGVGVYRSPLIGLTTVQQPVKEMAVHATEVMLARIRDASEPSSKVTYPGQFVSGRTLHPRPPGG